MALRSGIILITRQLIFRRRGLRIVMILVWQGIIAQRDEKPMLARIAGEMHARRNVLDAKGIRAGVLRFVVRLDAKSVDMLGGEPVPRDAPAVEPESGVAGLSGATGRRAPGPHNAPRFRIEAAVFGEPTTGLVEIPVIHVG